MDCFVVIAIIITQEDKTSPQLSESIIPEGSQSFISLVNKGIIPQGNKFVIPHMNEEILPKVNKSQNTKSFQVKCNQCHWWADNDVQLNQHIEQKHKQSFSVAYKNGAVVIVPNVICDTVPEKMTEINKIVKIDGTDDIDIFGKTIKLTK